MQVKCNINQAQLWLIVKVIIAINICLLIGSYVINSLSFHLGNNSRLLLSQADLGSENVVAAWYSSVLLICCAIMAFICFVIDAQRYTSGKPHFLNYGWIIFTACFVLLSFDELGSIHEHIGDSAGFAAAGDAIGSGVDEPGWKLFYVLVALVGLFMLVFGVLRLRRAAWSLLFVIIGVLLYLSNPFQEHFEIQSMRNSVNPASWRRPVYFLLIEEGSELFGSLSFLLATLLYAIKSGKENGDMVVQYKIPQSRLNVIIGSLLVTFFIIAMLVHIAFLNVQADTQTGVPKNWPPAIIAFMISLVSLYRYSDSMRWQYLLFTAFSISMSVYYGCNRFNYIFTEDHYRSSVLMRVLILIGSLIAFSCLNNMLDARASRLLAIASMLLLIASAFVKNMYYAEVAVAGLCCAFLVVIFNPIKRHQ